MEGSMTDSLMGHINDLEDRVSLLKEAIRIANETISCLSKERDIAQSRADNFQRLSAELSDKLNGTPCAEIRWRQKLDTTRAEALEEAAKIAEGSFAFDIEIWMNSTKKEMTANLGNAIAAAIRASATQTEQ
jgi:hypothetical protein